MLINKNMKRAVLCVNNPQDYIPQLIDHSIMIINPHATEARNRYLLENSDWSLLITNDDTKYRDGGNYPNERVLWYTSGTTGDSKFCSFTQAQLNNMAATIMRSYKLTANDRYTSIMSLWHAHGQGFYWATQLAGCEVKSTVADRDRNVAGCMCRCNATQGLGGKEPGGNCCVWTKSTVQFSCR